MPAHPPVCSAENSWAQAVKPSPFVLPICLYIWLFWFLHYTLAQVMYHANPAQVIREFPDALGSISFNANRWDLFSAFDHCIPAMSADNATRLTLMVYVSLVRFRQRGVEFGIGGVLALVKLRNRGRE